MRDSFPLVLATLFSLFIALYWLTDDDGLVVQVPKKAQLNVEVQIVGKQSFTPIIASYGRVQARTQGQVVSQIGGQITYLNTGFFNGGFFQQGELLVAIDKRDYQSDVDVANAGYLNAKQNYLQELAKAKQAKQDWHRAQGDSIPPDLVLRKPQLAAAEANLVSAEAKLNKAKLNLERTEITAPYDGYTLKKNVAIGQVIGANNVLGEIYAIDAFEVRLPLNNEDLPLVKLPSVVKGQTEVGVATNVTITSNLGKTSQWQGKLIRTEGAIDSASQQLHVIVSIPKPYQSSVYDQPLKIGQYVTAYFNGVQVSDVFVISPQAVYQNEYAYVVKGNELIKRKLDIVWRDHQNVVVKKGLNDGDSLVVTPLGQVPENIHVNAFTVAGVE
ncbi:efflux RND transporter periplasmic adaptor subunit [Catenovulum agarivorans]|uniref:efflux RND transporter periplasmic adaptor subunit n=1 Tax=Catenovulum agarivorans TaxID=1172192 RepID=UPI00031792C5|nr:efflux RND transporter periplasmic adaptor subunit [Catenovulum agarivorans]